MWFVILMVNLFFFWRLRFWSNVLIICFILLIFWGLLWIFVIVLNLLRRSMYWYWLVKLNRLVIFCVVVLRNEEINLFSFIRIIGSWSLWVIYSVSCVFLVLGELNIKYVLVGGMFIVFSVFVWVSFWRMDVIVCVIVVLNSGGCGCILDGKIILVRGVVVFLLIGGSVFCVRVFLFLMVLEVVRWFGVILIFLLLVVIRLVRDVVCFVFFWLVRVLCSCFICLWIVGEGVVKVVWYNVCMMGKCFIIILKMGLYWIDF